MISVSLLIQRVATFCGSRNVKMNITKYYPLEVFENHNATFTERSIIGHAMFIQCGIFLKRSRCDVAHIYIMGAVEAYVQTVWLPTRPLRVLYTYTCHPALRDLEISHALT